MENLPQRMIRRNPLLGHQITKHRRLLCVFSTHVVKAMGSTKEITEPPSFSAAW
jgi:hypothetical protein